MPNSRQIGTTRCFCGNTKIWIQWYVVKGWDAHCWEGCKARLSWSPHIWVPGLSLFACFQWLFKGMFLCTYMEGVREKRRCLHIQIGKGWYAPRYPDVLQDFYSVSPDVWIYRKLLPVLVTFSEFQKAEKDCLLSLAKCFLPGVRSSSSSGFQHYGSVLLKPRGCSFYINFK